jgi:hypothetical protein
MIVLKHSFSDALMMERSSVRWRSRGKRDWTEMIKKSKGLIQMMAVALAAICSLSVANATVTYQIGGAGLETIGINMPSVYVGNALAGAISIQQMPSQNNPSMPENYFTVCTDVGALLFLGRSYDYNSPATPFAGQTGINPMWGTGSNDGSAAKAIQNAAYIFNTFGQLTATGLNSANADLNTAIQLAVWGVLYNTDVNGQVTGSRISFSGENAAVSAYLTSFGLGSLTGNYNLDGSLLVPVTLAGAALANNGNEQPQELLIRSVPEASTVIAGALLLLPFAASTFKILRKKHSI